MSASKATTSQFQQISSITCHTSVHVRLINPWRCCLFVSESGTYMGCESTAYNTSITFGFCLYITA